MFSYTSFIRFLPLNKFKDSLLRFPVAQAEATKANAHVLRITNNITGLDESSGKIIWAKN